MYDLNVPYSVGEYDINDDSEGDILEYNNENLEDGLDDDFFLQVADDFNENYNDGSERLVDADSDLGDDADNGERETNEGNDQENDGCSIVSEPSVGKKFTCAMEMINYCDKYGEANGFSIRIRSSEKLKGDMDNQNEDDGPPYRKIDYSNYRKIRLVCSKQGVFKSQSRDTQTASNSCRSSCPFQVNGRVQLDGSWKLSKVVLQHNHECKSTNSKFLRNYRKISKGNMKKILDNDKAGVPISKNYNSFAVRFGCHESVPFEERDCRNIISSLRRCGMKHGDFVAMQNYFEWMSCTMKSDFFYTYETDEDGVLKNVFWADGRSRAAYKDFGDVVSFDTTYVSNRYKMPFAPIIGINHHGQTILFGCALLCGEETANFVWLFNAWMRCMGGKHPVGILTDQCKAIGNAIKEVFPSTRQRWCLWHVMKNGKKHLDKHPQWTEIYVGLRGALHNSLTITEFETAWNHLVSKYELDRYRWCHDMYEQRNLWAPVYFKDVFWAGMSSTQRSEGINFFFKGFVNANTTLKQFVEQYGLALSRRVKAEDKETFRSVNSPLICMTDHLFEQAFQKVYTNRKFKEFQYEVQQITYSNATKVEDNGTMPVYDVVTKKVTSGHFKTRCFKVTFDRQNNKVSCQCKNFEFKGILCSHALRVFHEEEIASVPERYIMDRWRKDLPREYMKVQVPYIRNNKPLELNRYEAMQNSFEQISEVAMTNESLYKDVMGALSALKKKLHVDDWTSDGNVNKRRYGPTVVEYQSEESIALKSDDTVKDPIDKRGKGRARLKRLGYYSEKSRNKRRPPTPRQSPGQASFVAPTYVPYYQPMSHMHNVFISPPYHFAPSPSSSQISQGRVHVNQCSDMNANLL